MFKWGKGARASMEIVRGNFVLKKLMEETPMDSDKLGFFDETKVHVMDPRGIEFAQRASKNQSPEYECFRCSRGIKARVILVKLRPCGCTPFCEGCMEWVARISEGRRTFQCVICDAVIKK